MKRRLKILHVIPAVARRYGGPSQAVFEMCRAVQSQGIDVLIATTDADGAGSLPVEVGRPIDYEGVQTIFFHRQWGERFGYCPPLARWLCNEVGNFDAVHIHAVFSHPCLAAARACRKLRVPYIVRPLGSLDPWSMAQKPIRKRLMWLLAAGRILREAAAVHYTASDERRLAERSLGLGRGAVIPLGIEVERLRDAGAAGLFRHRHNSLGCLPYILALSRIHPKKNIELLLDVFLSLTVQPEFENWRLVIAGDGEAEYIRSLQSLVAERGGGDKVIFSGWLGGALKSSALQDAALFALPSHQENFGIAVAEALACGVPALVSERVNLAPEIDQFRMGWVAPLDRAGFSAALAQALHDSDERKRRGEAGQNFVAHQLSWVKVAADLRNLYESVAGEGRSSKVNTPQLDPKGRGLFSLDS